MSATIIESTDAELVRSALESEAIGPEEARRRFVDFKTFYRNADDLEPNDRPEPSASKSRPSDALLFAKGIDSEESLLLWLTYYSRSKNCKIDCDGCKSVRFVPRAVNALYDILWPQARDQGADSADTLNSFWTTYGKVLKLTGTYEAPLKRAKGSCGKTVTGKEVAEEIRRDPLLSDCHDALIQDQLDLFAHLTHTLGNFIPCHGKFNGPRYRPTNDYWDLTLRHIRRWYLKEGSPSFVDACSGWLSSFGNDIEGWNTFVRENFLDPYVDDSGSVKLFFADHGEPSLNPSNLPATCDKALDCLRSINASIIARGNLMLASIEAISKNDCETMERRERAQELLSLVRISSEESDAA